MNGIERINSVIEHIEKNIYWEIDYRELAKIALVSEYEFRRIFSYVIGTPVAEYIRKRRLSLAAEEIKANIGSITEIGVKYGYDSPSSFTRAFKEHFGVSPQEARLPEVRLPVFVRPRLELTVCGNIELAYTELTLPKFFINGVCGESLYTDTCCCESVWKRYEESGADSGEIYAAYFNGENKVQCYIGEKSDERKAGAVCAEIPAGKWLSFDATDMQEKELNQLYEKILFSFLPSGIYKKEVSRPNIEVFGENNTTTVLFPVMI